MSRGALCSCIGCMSSVSLLQDSLLGGQHGHSQMHVERKEPVARFELLVQKTLCCNSCSPFDFGAAMDGDESYAS